ncbi:Mitochondrial substrate carrier family protein G [Tetrabaena socialis]|uniref:Mitochondrial substrate carrier family protein G n=1 Tax=Tetrabaena socialis TaxID=47790 RepID=A0A2J8A5J6_9CHLO|nr:Mitochondrial substrate carrier family protein G [Tetrabaena socialis]|eukprot:PNH07796.1 Mitochondrial substrate carrier family protein G [Tetrabaena socialis]
MSSSGQQVPAPAVSPNAGMIKLAKDIFAGTCGGISVTLVGHPFDTLKVRLQTQSMEKPIYSGVVDCARKTVQWEGLGGLYKGLGPTLLRNTPANAVYLGNFEVFKQLVAQRSGCSTTELSAGTITACAGLGGITYWLVIFPVDCIKSAMQTDAIAVADRKYKTIGSAARLLWAEGGVRRFYKGFTPCIIRAAPANGVMLLTVDKVSQFLNKEPSPGPATYPVGSGRGCEGAAGGWCMTGVTSPLMGQMFFRASLFGTFGASKRWLGTNSDGSARQLQRSDFYKAGAITGFVAAFTEGPIDFYKSQLQVQIIRSKQDPTYKAPYTSVLDCVRQTIKANGFRGPFQLLEDPGLPRTARSTEAVCCPGGITYWLVIFPVDCIKSAMQTDAIAVADRKYKTIGSAARLLWAEGGVRRFYKGFTPCIIRAAPANGVMLLTVDKVSQFLNKE